MSTKTKSAAVETAPVAEVATPKAPKTEKVAKVKKEKVEKVPGQRGRKIDESSQRQLRLKRFAEKREKGIEVKRGRPVGSKEKKKES